MALARAENGFAFVATTLAMAEASRRAVARHRAALIRSRTLCEELVEHLGWLQRPDEPDRVTEVLDSIVKDVAALEVCIGRTSGMRPVPAPPIEVELAALVEAIDAEIRLADLGDPFARRRAGQMAMTLRAGARGLAHMEESW